MKHTQFRIGLEFYTATGAWRCTDVGTRVVTALKINQADPRVYGGPPYAVAEWVFDEHDQDACTLRPQPLVVTGALENQAVVSARIAASTEALQSEVDRLRQVCAEAYHLAAVIGVPARVLDNLWAAAQGKALPHASFLPVSADECGRPEPI